MGKNKKNNRKPGKCSTCGVLISEHVGRTGKYCRNTNAQDFLKDSARNQNKDSSSEMAGKTHDENSQIDETERDDRKEVHLPVIPLVAGRGRGRGRARGRGSRSS